MPADQVSAIPTELAGDDDDSETAAMGWGTWGGFEGGVVHRLEAQGNEHTGGVK